MDGYEYEELCATFLKRCGFKGVEVTSGSLDQGIDIIAYKGNKKYGIQCKYYDRPVGNKAVQEAYSGAAFYECDVAVVMTNATFTRSANELSESLEVDLWPELDEKTMKHQWIVNGVPSSRIFYRLNIIMSLVNIAVAVIIGSIMYSGISIEGIKGIYVAELFIFAGFQLVAGVIGLFDRYKSVLIISELILYIAMSFVLGLVRLVMPVYIFIPMCVLMLLTVIVEATRLIASVYISRFRVIEEIQDSINKEEEYE